MYPYDDGSSSLQQPDPRDLCPMPQFAFYRNTSIFNMHHSSQQNVIGSELRRTYEGVLHYHLAAKDPALLETFAERAIPLHLHRIDLLKTVQGMVDCLSADLIRYHQEHDSNSVNEALESYVKYKMELVKKEKKEFETLTKSLLPKDSPGYSEAERYFSFLKKEHHFTINDILELAEMKLEGDDKKEVYRIQKQLEREKIVKINVGEGPDEAVPDGIKMEVDPQPSEDVRNEIDAETLVRDEAIKRRRTESTSCVGNSICAITTQP